MSVADNLQAVRQRIERAGGDPGKIAIVAVTKGFGTDVSQAALDAGLRILGENRVQEAVEKMETVNGAEWHLIGHLQTNKVKLAAGRFALIQSIDSAHLAEALARINVEQKVLVEVNVAREPRKTGADPAEAAMIIDAVAETLDLQGLMAMGPAEGDPRATFDELRTLRDAAQERLGKALPILSMGMSGDFEIAVKAGSTMLRLGQVLFGPRPARAAANLK
ncbi:MAG TPA: YggS family pyridoxal phosphate-dependent enzyme [Candidatus Dormibacteraeota bacterium]|nr:YggS family pyridoxal phosphate-dependent enzyme [Candidatus Dormibacteraeota bacterium]